MCAHINTNVYLCVFSVSPWSRSHIDLFTTSWKWPRPWRQTSLSKGKITPNLPPAPTSYSYINSFAWTHFSVNFTPYINRESGGKKIYCIDFFILIFYINFCIVTFQLQQRILHQVWAPGKKWPCKTNTIFVSVCEHCSLCLRRLGEERANSLHLYITPPGLQREITEGRCWTANTWCTGCDHPTSLKVELIKTCHGWGLIS